MGCMKCGRDTLEDQVFCEACREDMKNYPVKPNIAVQLPQRNSVPVAKRSPQIRRRILTNEEIIRRLRKRCRIFLALWLVTALLLTATGFFAARYFFGEAIRLPGQNYSTFTTIETQAP